MPVPFREYRNVINSIGRTLTQFITGRGLIAFDDVFITPLVWGLDMELLLFEIKAAGVKRSMNKLRILGAGQDEWVQRKSLIQ